MPNTEAPRSKNLPLPATQHQPTSKLPPISKVAQSLRPGVSLIDAYVAGNPEAIAIIDSWRCKLPITTLSRQEYATLLEEGSRPVFSGKRQDNDSDAHEAAPTGPILLADADENEQLADQPFLPVSDGRRSKPLFAAARRALRVAGHMWRDYPSPVTLEALVEPLMAYCEASCYADDTMFMSGEHEDLAADLFTRLWPRVGKLRGVDYLDLWVKAAFRNFAADCYEGTKERPGLNRRRDEFDSFTFEREGSSEQEYLPSSESVFSNVQDEPFSTLECDLLRLEQIREECSDAERLLMDGLSELKTWKQIGDLLNLSQPTVRERKSALLTKLEAKMRPEVQA